MKTRTIDCTRLLLGILAMMLAASAIADDDATMGEAATIAVLESVFGEAIGALALGKNKAGGGWDQACDFAQILTLEAAAMLAEPHQTTYRTVSAHCLFLSLGVENESTRLRIVAPMTLWVCEYGSDGLRKVVNACGTENVARLRTQLDSLSAAD